MTVINYETGEISDSTDLVPVENVAALNTLEPAAREMAVTQMLGEARSWLAHAVEATEPQSVAHFKAFIATVAESTKQLNLSKEIQLDAQEMVRRAERGVGKAIRKGQEEGVIRKKGDDARTDLVGHNNLVSPYVYASRDEMHGNGSGIADLVDGVSDDRFDEAVEEAKAEGNLSRANVVRKVRGAKDGSTESRRQRADRVADLAEKGYSSRQIAEKVGLGFKAIRDISRDFDIEVPADKMIGKARRHDSNRIAQETVNALSGLAMGVELIDFDDLHAGDAAHWANSLDDSLRALNRFRKQIKEITQ